MYIANPVKIGNLVIGGQNPVIIQSMTNTDTMDTVKTVEQVMRLADVGCELVRITASGMKEARNLENIKSLLIAKSYTLPLCADIHYFPQAAITAAEFVEKVRINPGNYLKKSQGEVNPEMIAPLIEACKKYQTVIRIGVNHGSLSERILSLYGNTAQGMLMSALEFINVFEALHFHDLVLSMKSSHVKTMIQAVSLLAEELSKREYAYPLHLGVTEAGNGMDGRLISAIGIGTLLKEGIGDTIRVSLTEDPECEIPVAKQIIEAAQKFKNAGDLLSFPFDQDKKEIQAAVLFGSQMLKGRETGYDLDEDLQNDLLQAAGVKFYKTQFIACPSCGRTKYDIQKALKEVKEKLSHYQGLKIAVMGCIVNGPGEMADAHYGYVGAGEGGVHLYKKGRLVMKNIPETEAVEVLEKMILEDKEES